MVSHLHFCILKSSILYLVLNSISYNFKGLPQKAFDAGNKLFDAKHGVKMGVPDGGCDDAKTSLEVDWNENSVNYTCFYPTKPFLPDANIESLMHCDNVPPNFYPSESIFQTNSYAVQNIWDFGFSEHHCMNEQITYKELLPTYGDHRPLWPKFGEYR